MIWLWINRNDLVVDFRTHTHCMKSIKSIRGLSSAMHWRFKSNWPNPSCHSPLPPAFGRSANPPGPFCRRVVCCQSSCCSSSSLAHLLHCVNRLWCELTCCLSLWYLHCYLELWTMIILTFLRSNGRDSSFKVAWLTLSANCVLFARKEQCSYRVLPCPSFSWVSYTVIGRECCKVAPLPSIGRFLAQAGRGITVWDYSLRR